MYGDPLLFKVKQTATRNGNEPGMAQGMRGWH